MLSINADDQPDDVYFVDPFAVEIPEEMGNDLPMDDVLQMAISLHADGQYKPVKCRRLEGDRLTLTEGAVRTAAARLIRHGFRYVDPLTKMEVAVKDHRLKLKVMIAAPSGN